MYCAHCGIPNDDSARFCEKCGTALLSTSHRESSSDHPSPPTPAQSPLDGRMRGMKADGKQYPENKTPWLALLLSGLVVGVGQFYNGDIKKGAVMLIVALVAAWLTAGIGWLALAVWSMVDAWQVASRKWPLW